MYTCRCSISGLKVTNVWLGTRQRHRGPWKGELTHMQKIYVIFLPDMNSLIKDGRLLCRYEICCSCECRWMLCRWCTEERAVTFSAKLSWLYSMYPVRRPAYSSVYSICVWWVWYDAHSSEDRYKSPKQQKGDNYWKPSVMMSEQP